MSLMSAGFRAKLAVGSGLSDFCRSQMVLSQRLATMAKERAYVGVCVSRAGGIQTPQKRFSRLC